MSSDLSAQSWASRLPTKITPLVHGLAIASLVSQVGIIVTGGAVRLTKSGLGCSRWPNCVPGSMTPVPEMGIHGIIEFGNRTLTFVLLFIAIAFLISVWSMRRSHSTIFKLGLILLLGIPAQGVIGGITVLTGLNPWIVSLHFLLSGTLVMLATLLVNRTRTELKKQVSPPATKSLRQVSTAAWIFSIVSVILGTIVTGTGPHAGDATAPRHMFDPSLVTRMHTAPVYLLVIATIALIIMTRKSDVNRRLRTSVWWLVVVILIQAAIGYTQHFTGLPIGLVLLHMLGASLLLVSSTDPWDRTSLLPKYQRVDN